MNENNGVVLDKETIDTTSSGSSGSITLKEIMVVMISLVVIGALLYVLVSAIIDSNHRPYENSIKATEVSLNVAVEKDNVPDDAVVSGNSDMKLLGDGKIDGVNKFALKAPASIIEKTSDYSTIISGTVANHEIKIIKARTGELVATYNSEKDEITYE